MSFLKIWGCQAYVKRLISDKLAPKSDKCLFVGYPKETKGYYFYNAYENKVFVARNGVFLEREFISKGTSGSTVQLEEIQEPQSSIVPSMEPPGRAGTVRTQCRKRAHNAPCAQAIVCATCVSAYAHTHALNLIIVVIPPLGFLHASPYLRTLLLRAGQESFIACLRRGRSRPAPH